MHGCLLRFAVYILEEFRSKEANVATKPFSEKCLQVFSILVVLVIISIKKSLFKLGTSPMTVLFR